MPGGIEPKRGQIEPNIGYLGKLRKPEFWNCITFISCPVQFILRRKKNLVLFMQGEVYPMPGEIYKSGPYSAQWLFMLLHHEVTTFMISDVS